MCPGNGISVHSLIRKTGEDEDQTSDLLNARQYANHCATTVPPKSEYNVFVLHVYCAIDASLGNFHESSKKVHIGFCQIYTLAFYQCLMILRLCSVMHCGQFMLMFFGDR